MVNEIVKASEMSPSSLAIIDEVEKLIEQVEVRKKAKGKEQVQAMIPTRKIVNFPYVNFMLEPLRVWENLEPILQSEKIYPVYNEIEKDYEIKGLNVRGLDHQTMDVHSLCHRYGFAMSYDFIAKAIARIASKNSYNPVVDYLESCDCNWDEQKGRIKEVFDTLQIKDGFSKDLAYRLFVKWLVSTATIPYNEGDNQTQGVLVFQGRQGCGKTTFIQILVPIYLKTGLDLDPTDKDKIRNCVKYWVVELGELDSTMKADQAKLKAFLSEKEDEFRIPYDRSPQKYPRKTAFFGTVNKEEFLKDETGDRRYWVIPVEDIDIDTLRKIDINQFWGEVMDLKDSGKIQMNLSKEELAELDLSNSDFRASGYMQIKVETGFNWDLDKKYWNWISSAEIADRLKLKTTVGLGEIIKKTGGIEKRTKSRRGYVVPPFKGDFSPVSNEYNPF